MSLNENNILEVALDWLRMGRKLAIATVIDTWGSAPREVGSQLLISSDKDFMGSVSGGCVEAAVVETATKVIYDRVSRIEEYAVSDASAFAVGLPCGGTIKVSIEPVGISYGIEPYHLKKIVHAKQRRKQVALLTNFITNEREIIKSDKEFFERSKNIEIQSKSIFLEGKSFFRSGVFVNIYNPHLHLIIIGAVHIAQSLVNMSNQVGFKCTVIDPRVSFASTERFPNTKIVHDWPDIAIQSLIPDRHTAIVILSHDSKLDDPAVNAALVSEAFYIGCLGSKRTHLNRVKRLKNFGHSARSMSKIKAPIGLKIGASNPVEIALSILSEIVKCYRKSAKNKSIEIWSNKSHVESG